MAFDFPASPTDGQVYAPVGGPDYVWRTASGVWEIQTGGSNSAFVAKSGDVMSGDLTITKANPTFAVNKTSIVGAVIAGKYNGAMRWGVNLGAGDAETGGSEGSGFYISRYTDAGAAFDVMNINRATGLTYLYGGLTVSGGDLRVAKATPAFILNRPDVSSVAQIWSQVNGLNRWQIQIGNGTPEPGSNVGSDLAIGRFADNGNVLDYPFNIIRSTGIVNATKGLGVTGAPLTVTNTQLTLTWGNARSALQLLSGNAANYIGLGIGRTAYEGELAVAAGGGHFLGAAVAGDIILMNGNAGNTLHLGIGSTSILRATSGGVAITGNATVSGAENVGSTITTSANVIANGAYWASTPGSGALAAPNGSVSGRQGYFGLAGEHNIITITGGTGWGCMVSGRWDPTGGYYNYISCDATSNFSASHMMFCRDGGATQMGAIAGNGSGGIAYNNFSDRRMKKNIRDARGLIDGVDLIKKMRVRVFDMLDTAAKDVVGFIAQEAAEVIPAMTTPPQEMVWTDQETGEVTTKESPWMIENSAAIPFMIEAMQTMVTQIEALTAEVAALKAAR